MMQKLDKNGVFLLKNAQNIRKALDKTESFGYNYNRMSVNGGAGREMHVLRMYEQPRDRFPPQ